MIMARTYFTQTHIHTYPKHTNTQKHTHTHTHKHVSNTHTHTHTHTHIHTDTHTHTPRYTCSQNTQMCTFSQDFSFRSYLKKGFRERWLIKKERGKLSKKERKI